MFESPPISTALVPHITTPDSKVHGAYMGPTLALSAPGGFHVGPMNLAIRDHILLIQISSPIHRLLPYMINTVLWSGAINIAWVTSWRLNQLYILIAYDPSWSTANSDKAVLLGDTSLNIKKCCYLLNEYIWIQRFLCIKYKNNTWSCFVFQFTDTLLDGSYIT